MPGDSAPSRCSIAVAPVLRGDPDGFSAYTTYDLPIAGLSTVSMARVMNGAFMMSHSNNFLYRATSG